MLTAIKIAGFKSFADPVSISLDDRLVGIVGPNGCGKSNVADALRWVLGEGSAKSLRADSMGEVIFAGTRDRKALGRADVELVFDNQQGSFGGEYARYSEISVRREVFSKGESRYYLNGSLCRRRDIAGLFLGTGLGSPNYAIVQQGMINRFIEARPDELRLYLEEAAGISYFRKQKRESESNLRRTAENLDQVRERLDEINRHIAHLHSQTRNATRHRELNEELLHLKACLHRRQQESLKQRIGELESAIGAREKELEDGRLARDALALEIDQKRVSTQELRTQHGETVERYHRANNQFGNLEQDISRSQEEIVQIGERLKALGSSGEEMLSHIDTDKGKLQSLQGNLVESDENIARLEAQRDEALAQAQELESKLAEVRKSYHDTQGQLRVAGQQEEFDSATASSLEEDIRARQKALEEREGQLRELMHEDNIKQLAQAQESFDRAQSALAENESQWRELQQESQQTQQQWQDRNAELEEVRERHQELVPSLSQMRALQEAAGGHDPGDSANWLAGSRWRDNARLRSQLSVEPGWELVAELVLGQLLNAVHTKERLEDVGDAPAFGDGELALLLDDGSSATAGGGLSEFIKGPPELAGLLAGIEVAGSYEEAVAKSAESGVASVVTKEGVWLSRRWLRVLHKPDDSSRVMVREREISQLQGELDKAIAAQESLKSECERLAAERDRQQTRLGELQELVAAKQGDLQTAAANLASAQTIIDKDRERAEEAKTAAAALREEIGGLERQLNELLGSRAQLGEDTSRITADLERLSGEEGDLVESHSQAHEAYLQSRDELQSAQLEKSRDSQEIEQLETTIDRFTGQLGQQREESERLEGRRKELGEHIELCQGRLSETIEERQRLEGERKEMEQTLAEAGDAIEADSAKLSALSREIEQGANEQSEWRIELSRHQSDAENAAEHLAELDLDEGFEVREDIAALDSEEIEERIERARRRLERIGPVNLIAESEQREESERAAKLTAQVEDLEKSCASLRDTMARMEEEINRKYRATFTEVNANLKVLFERMFAGGEAYLKEHEDEEEAKPLPGVLLMAQPPGKRIARIQQLSGGERTLAAIALMFAFFKLNPAPFCLLDEVDAPLDDINVNRYCSLLNEMSSSAQFIIITHNKITMSRLHVLHGVTMPNAGVSRIVDVDLRAAQRAAAG